MNKRTVINLTVSVLNNYRLFSDKTAMYLIPAMNTKNNIITNYTLNNLLLKQQVTITQEWLN